MDSVTDTRSPPYTCVFRASSACRRATNARYVVKVLQEGQSVPLYGAGRGDGDGDDAAPADDMRIHAECGGGVAEWKDSSLMRCWNAVEGGCSGGGRGVMDEESRLQEGGWDGLRTVDWVGEGEGKEGLRCDDTMVAASPSVGKEMSYELECVKDQG